MLSLVVCKKCINKADIDNDCDGAIAWDEVDEDHWDNGVVYCPVISEQKFTAIKDRPPEWCEYKLEHAVGETNG